MLMGPNEIILLRAISLLDTEEDYSLQHKWTLTHTVGVYINL